MKDLFDLTGKVAVVTGGAGLLGLRHCEVLLAAGAKVVSLDKRTPEADPFNDVRDEDGRRRMWWLMADVTDLESLSLADKKMRLNWGLNPPDILINNACNNPRMAETASWEMHSPQQWKADLEVGLTGPYLCSMFWGSGMAQRGSGVILNIASEYGIIAPDQRLYRRPGLLEHQQPIKPTSYSVVKHGLIGLTKWLATYYAGKGVRVNSLSPGGVENGQPEEFVERYVNTVPLGRMSTPSDYQGAVLFLCSEASAFMTGANLVMDGGRSCW